MEESTEMREGLKGEKARRAWVKMVTVDMEKDVDVDGWTWKPSYVLIWSKVNKLVQILVPTCPSHCISSRCNLLRSIELKIRAKKKSSSRLKFYL